MIKSLKKIYSLISMILIISIIIPQSAFANGTSKANLFEGMRYALIISESSPIAFSYNNRVYINERDKTEKPRNINGSLFVPARLISSSYHLELSWLPLNKGVTIEFGTKEIQLIANSKNMLVDNDVQTLPQAPFLENDTFYIPLRAVVEALSKDIYIVRNGIYFITDKEHTYDRKLQSDIVKLFEERTEEEKCIYVSTDGNDENDGSIEHPFATFEAAKEKVREMKKDGMNSDIYVYFRGGTYNVEEEMLFSAEDSGENNYNVIYKNFENEKVYFVGTKEVSDWKLYRGNIYKTYVGADKTYDLIYENGKMAHKAAYPNRLEEDYLGFLKSEPIQITKNKLAFKKGDIPEIKNIKDAEVYVWGGGGILWFSYVIKINDIDYDANVITVDKEILSGGGKAGSWYYIQGALELLDAPREFYYDSQSGWLYYCPSDGEITGKTITVPTADNIIKICGEEEKVHNIVIDGMDIGNTTRPDVIWDKLTVGGNGIHIENAENITIQNCNIHDVGGNGIYLFNNCINNKIYNNNIKDVGVTGISFAESNPTGMYLEPGNDVPWYGDDVYDKVEWLVEGNDIYNNKIEGTSNLVGHGHGIYVNVAGARNNYVRHNVVSDSRRIGIIITYAVGRNYLEYNDISMCNTGSEDTGVFYTMYMSKSYGPVIRRNYIHDSYASIGGASAFYNDENSHGVVEIENVVDTQTIAPRANEHWLKTIYSGGFMSKGVNLTISNNVIANSPQALQAITLGHSYKMPKNKDFTITKNIVYNHGKTMYNILNWLDGYLKDVDYNIYFNGNDGIGMQAPTTSYEEWLKFDSQKYDNNSLTQNPMFTDGDNYDYRLSYKSPAHKLAIKQVNVQKTGVTNDFPYVKDGDLKRIYLTKQGDVSYNPTINLISGETQRLEVSGRTVDGFVDDLSDAKVVFKSKNPNVVTVNENGVIKGINKGVAEVNVSVTKGDVTLTQKMDIIVEDKVLNIDKVYNKQIIQIGKDEILNAYPITELGQCDPRNVKFEYSSSNPGVISVNSLGYLKAISKGTANILVKATLNGKTFEKTFTFKAVPELFEKITVEYKGNSFEIGKEHEIPVKAVGNLGNALEYNLDEAQYSMVDSSVAEITGNSKESIYIKANKVGVTNLNIEIEIDGIKKKIDYKIVVGGSNDTLPEPWKVINFKSSGGYASKTNDEFTIISTGDNVFGPADDATFMCKSVPNADKAVVYATIKSIENVGSNNTAAGPMIRADESDASNNVQIRLQGGVNLLMTYRNAEKPKTGYISGPSDVTAPVDLKLEKDGNVVNGYYRRNGETEWTLLGTVEVELGDNPLAGYALYSNVKDTFASSVFKNIIVE